MGRVVGKAKKTERWADDTDEETRVEAEELLGDLAVWVQEVRSELEAEIEKERKEIEGWCEVAWDDVHGKELRMSDVRAERKEEVEHMQGRGIWSVVDVEE